MPCPTRTHSALTDVQFSVVALMTPEGRIVERVVYDPYGRGRHHYAADYDGNGAVEVADLNGTYGHLTAWFADDMQADWDRNGTTNGDTPDIFAFQTDWFAQSGNAVAAGQISRRYAAGSGINANAPDNMIGYCGYVFNPETDDYTVRFRHYDPEIGRWLERDPAGYVDSMSAYLYGVASPAVSQDPLGLCSAPPSDLIAKPATFYFNALITAGVHETTAAIALAKIYGVRVAAVITGVSAEILRRELAKQAAAGAATSISAVLAWEAFRGTTGELAEVELLALGSAVAELAQKYGKKMVCNELKKLKSPLCDVPRSCNKSMPEASQAARCAALRSRMAKNIACASIRAWISKFCAGERKPDPKSDATHADEIIKAIAGATECFRKYQCEKCGDLESEKGENLTECDYLKVKPPTKG